MKKFGSFITAAVMSVSAVAGSLTFAAAPALTADAAVAYPVQEFRIGMADTDHNVAADGTELKPAMMQGTSDEKWSLNFVSSGVFEIVSSADGKILTANGSNVSLAPDTDAASQRWKIEGVTKDFDGYYLYYKITSNADPSKALTFTDGAGFGLSDYSGGEYQKYKINLDGVEGFAANCMTSAGEKACTVGGLFGETVFVSTADELEKQANTTEPKTIVVTADIDMQKKSHTRIRDNKTIVGCYGSHTVYDSYFRTNNEYGKEGDNPSDNIIIRNLKMVAKNCPNRILINIWSSRQIWIDHIYFESQLSYDRKGNGQDEVGKFIWINTPYESYMDAKDRLRSPDYVTISYCHLKNRYWTVAYGTQNDEITRDRTTLLYNWWDENVRRCPQLGNGSAHVYNNYYSAYGTKNNGSATSGIIGGDGSDMLSENNMFNGYSLQQALMMGSGNEPCRDSGSYISGDLNGTASKVSFKPKKTSSWYPNKTNYGYSLLDAYNSKNTDTKAFCTKYAGDKVKASDMKYITDSDFASWVTTKYESPFLRHVEFSAGKSGMALKDGGVYSFKNVGSGLYLGSADGKAENDNDVQQLAKAQKWTVKAADNGYYRVYSEVGDGSYLLNLDYGKPENGTNINIYQDTKSDAQLFKFFDNGDGTVAILTRATLDKSGIGIVAGSKDEAASAVEWAYDGADNQRWIIENASELVNMQVLDGEHLGAYDIAEAKTGALIFGDRDKTFDSLPEELSGGALIQTACDSKNTDADLAKLTANGDITVYVLMDTRVANAPKWLANYEKTDLTAGSGDVKFTIYAVDVKDGESITLGTNGQASGCWNYSVIAVRASEKLTEGDVNADGEVGVSDLVMLEKFLLNTGALTSEQSDAADLDHDGVLDVYDLVLLRKVLISVI